MVRRFSLLVALVTTLALVPAGPARAQGGFTFNGIATEQCLGCPGTGYGTFEGVLTGVVHGHVYSSARLTMDYATLGGLGDPPLCGLSSSSSGGNMRVSDTTHSHEWYITITRAYYGALLFTFSGDSDGAGVGTYVIVDPVGHTCLGPARVDLRGTAVVV